jgi:peptidoglycan/LPS O-acetylase OafA/YrhL
LNPVPGYLPTLDGWRAVAIAGVVLCHVSDEVFASHGLLPSPALLGLAKLGSKGVDLFFAISGFLITSRLLEEHRQLGHISLRKFYIRRACRILPPYLVLIATVGLGVWAGLWAVSTVDFATCLTFTRNYLAPIDSGSWYTGHIWSLCVEEHFYLLWPGLLVLLGPRRSLPWSLRISAMLVAWSMVEFRLQLLSRVLPGVGYSMRSDICMANLLVAAAACLLVEYHPALVKRVVGPGTIWPALSALAFVLLTNPPLAHVWEMVLMPVLIVATVLWPATAVGRALEFPLVGWVGRISYSLYLWQQLFLIASTTPQWPVQRLPWNLVCAIGCAALSYYTVERPMMQLGRRLAPPVSMGHS